MLLLTLFALIAGAATALSPCVLPVLPAVLAAGTTGGRRRPLGVVAGLTLSFTFATVALVYVIDALGLPGDITRTIAIVVLASFGLILLIPPLGDRVEAFASRLVGGPRAGRGEGLWSGLPARGQPRPRLRALRRADPGRRDHGLGLAGADRRQAGDRPRLRGRDRRGALRDPARRQEADRSAGADPRQGQPGDGRGDDRRRPDAGDEPRHPLRDLPRPPRALGARQPDPRGRGQLGDRRRSRLAARLGPPRLAAGGAPAGGGGPLAAGPRPRPRASPTPATGSTRGRFRSPAFAARSC